MAYPLRLAVIRDFRAEGWPSMDLCADQLLADLPSEVQGIDVAPLFRHLLGRLPKLGRAGFNADRLLNRHFLLPQHVRSQLRHADFVHIADHSYAHLALSLPATRVGVYCHDLDAFRCFLEPGSDRRPSWFRWLAGRALAGLCRAAVVFHNSAEVGRQLRDRNLVYPDRLVHAPLGVAADFTPVSNPAAISELQPGPYLLHVGNDMPRKRLDVLLDLFTEVSAVRPELRLVQVGPSWTTERSRQITRLRIGERLVKLTGLGRPQLAELYRNAAAVLVPSEAEGFGLPVIEALACGAIVIASDIPVLREVGGNAVIYSPVAAIDRWTSTINSVLNQPHLAPSRNSRLQQAAKYSWREHARIISEAYLRLK